MRELLPYALLGLALMLGSYYGRSWLRALRRLFAFPAYGTTALCPHCARPLAQPTAHVCPDCVLPISGFAATDPVMQVLATGALYRQATRRLVGAGLAGFFLIAGSAVAVAVVLVASGQWREALQALIAAVPAFVVLVRSRLARHAQHSGA